MQGYSATIDTPVDELRHGQRRHRRPDGHHQRQPRKRHGVGQHRRGSLAKSGAGTVVMSGTANSYTGNTTVNGGTLQAGLANVLPLPRLLS